MPKGDNFWGRAVRETCGLQKSKEKETEFTMMSVSDGSRRTIKTIDTQPARSTRHCFSAESELIAYSRPAEAGSTNRDVYLIDIRSGEETRLTGNAPDEAVLGWTPDGRHLLIEMNRQANMDAWLLTIEDRKLRGEPRLVKRDLGIVEPLGITRRGTFHYTIAFGGPSIFVADVDYKSATASASMLWTDKFALDDNIQVRAWSPDAKHVAIRQFEYGRSELKIISTEGGEIRTLQPKLEFRASGMHWAPDGRSILIFAKQADEQAVDQATRGGDDDGKPISARAGYETCKDEDH
jgi:Tol biopolymer transport system component